MEIGSSDSDNGGYSEYLVSEWEMFDSDVARQAGLIDAVSGDKIGRVLDIGCGAGQEMMPFLSRGARGFGIDTNLEAGHVSKEMYRRKEMEERIAFVCATGTKIPFGDQFFDLVICRISLMYMDNRSALREIHRVLKRDGKLMLKYHSPTYYWVKLIAGVKSLEIRSAVHATRVLCGGYYYYFTGRQLFNKLTAAGEIFQTERTLKREFAPLELSIVSPLPDTNTRTPSILVAKE